MPRLHISSAMFQRPEEGPEAVRQRHHQGAHDGHSAAWRGDTLPDYQTQTIQGTGVHVSSKVSGIVLAFSHDDDEDCICASIFIYFFFILYVVLKKIPRVLVFCMQVQWSRAFYPGSD